VVSMTDLGSPGNLQPRTAFRLSRGRWVYARGYSNQTPTLLLRSSPVESFCDACKEAVRDSAGRLFNQSSHPEDSTDYHRHAHVCRCTSTQGPNVCLAIDASQSKGRPERVDNGQIRRACTACAVRVCGRAGVLRIWGAP
jgi:hypothetical protein